MALNAPRTLNAPIGLQILRLDPQRPVVVGPARRDQRRAHHISADPFRRRADVVDGDQLHGSSLARCCEGRYFRRAVKRLPLDRRRLDVEPSTAPAPA